MESVEGYDEQDNLINDYLRVKLRGQTFHITGAKLNELLGTQEFVRGDDMNDIKAYKILMQSDDYPGEPNFPPKQIFEDLLPHPPSPPHYEPVPSTSPIPTSLIFTSPSVPPTSPTPSTPLALITVPQPIPSLHFPSFSLLSHLPPLPIPLPMPTASTPSPSSSYADKKGKKDPAV
ncbi:vegetative cell wall protein gp1-like [Neltuma alba]|uniref:vegetative cell wall protein gp1-like n=1 Tax=Neltuma alba TaxID=207710 RepID=UPI0010A349C9|nr:vegetative cell wall protein gp1-like [Prosopis alba]